ncbi:MAG: YidB family protein [Methylophilus sp.]
MGLFDNIAGAVLGKMMGDKGAMAQAALEMFNQYGGLEGVLEKFNQAGLGNLVTSWVSKGENMPISPNQITEVLGGTTIADMAAKFGLTPEMLSAQIAEHLPNVVDKLTPDGKVEANSGDLLSTVVGMLK